MNTSNSIVSTWKTGKKVVEETVTEIFDGAGNLIERKVVTVTRTEDVPNTVPYTPYPQRYPYQVWYEGQGAAPVTYIQNTA